MDRPFNLNMLYLIIVCLLWASCSQGNTNGDITTLKKPVKPIDLQGHRGARGAMPENSIPGFVYAMEQGVTTLELDVVISKDGQVVVSHDPIMNDMICLNVGDSVYRIYDMTYAEVKTFDCGSKGNERFPDQMKLSTYKPTLVSVIDTVEALVNRHGKQSVRYNIETKSTPEGDGILHPAPDTFAMMVNNVVLAKGIRHKVTIQSFDVRTLQAFSKFDSRLPLVLLVEEDTISYEEQISQLGFTPQAYSPYYALVDSELVAKVHADSMKLVPWTVNDSTTMMNLLNLGVDGIITDLPKLGRRIVDQYQNQ